MNSASRPVPSRAALQTLRRLAYISSGTACGTAALVAEEQRRRATVVQKIADNATRLKRHSRRLHLQTETTAMDSHDTLFPAHHFSCVQHHSTRHGQTTALGSHYRWSNPSASLDRPRVQMTSPPLDGRAAFLPTQVEHEYAKIIARPSSLKKTLPRSHDIGNPNGQTSDGTSTSTSETSSRRQAPEAPLPVRPEPDFDSLRRAISSAIASRNWKSLDEYSAVLFDINLPHAQQTSLAEELLCAFASHHTPQQLVAYITSLAKQSATPTDGTLTSTAFDALLKRRDSALIITFLDELHSAGIKPHLRPYQITAALRCYYRNMRPSYRYLTQHLTTIEQRTNIPLTRHFLLLRAEAISHDLRRLQGVNVRRQKRLQAQRNAQDILQQLSASDSDVGNVDKTAISTVIREVNIRRISESVKDERIVKGPTQMPRHHDKHIQKQLEQSLEPSTSRDDALWLDSSVDADTVTDHVDPTQSLVDQIQNPSQLGNATLDRLVAVIKQYYVDMQSRGQSWTHHVTITAAKRLMETGRHADGVELLRTVYASQWTTNNPFDIVAMTVLLTGYVHLGSISGTDWVLSKILNNNIQIDLKFVQQVSRMRDNVKQRAKQPSLDHQRSNVEQLAIALERYHIQARDKLQDQIKSTDEFGKRLTDCLIRSIESESTPTTSQTNASATLPIRKMKYDFCDTEKARRGSVDGAKGYTYARLRAKSHWLAQKQVVRVQ